MSENGRRALSEDLENLICEIAPEYDGTDERRRRTLTRDDLRIIAALIDAKNAHVPCSMGLTPEEIQTGKQFFKLWKKISSIVGTAVILAIVGFFIAVFGLGFDAWVKLKAAVAATK